MRTTGTVLGPKYAPFLVETESSGQKCVKLVDAGEYVEFTAQSPANTMVVRYSLPDAPDGGGINSTLSLFQNGKFVKKLFITSRYSWLYGKYPFTNDPKTSKPRDFYDEVRVKGLRIAKGDLIRLQKPHNDVPYCIIDLVDLENVAPSLPAPTNSLSVRKFGADGAGRNRQHRGVEELHRGSQAAGQNRLGARRRLQVERRHHCAFRFDDPRCRYVAHNFYRRCRTL